MRLYALLPHSYAAASPLTLFPRCPELLSLLQPCDLSYLSRLVAEQRQRSRLLAMVLEGEIVERVPVEVEVSTRTRESRRALV